MVFKDKRMFVLIILFTAFVCRRVHVNQNGLKLLGTHQLLVYADDVNTRWAKSRYTVYSIILMVLHRY